MNETITKFLELLVERDAILTLREISQRGIPPETRADLVGRITLLSPGLSRLLGTADPQQLRAAQLLAGEEIPNLLNAASEMMQAEELGDFFIEGLSNIATTEPGQLLFSGVRDFSRSVSGLRRLILSHSPKNVLQRELEQMSPEARLQMWVELLRESNKLSPSLAGKSGALARTALQNHQSYLQLGQISITKSAQAPGAQPQKSHRISTKRDEDYEVETKSNAVVFQQLHELSDRLLQLESQSKVQAKDQPKELQTFLEDTLTRLRTLEKTHHDLQGAVDLLRAEHDTLTKEQLALSGLMRKLVEELPGRYNQIEELRNKIQELEIYFQTRLNKLIIPVNIHIRDKDIDQTKGRQIASAALEYLRTFSFEDEDHSNWTERAGSFFARMKLALNIVLDKQGIESKLRTLEEGLENHYVRLPNSQVNLNEAEAASKLIAALADVQNAAIVIGPAILVKRTNNDKCEVFVVPLLPKIRKKMEDNPSCLASPEEFFQMLSAVQETEIRQLNLFEPMSKKS